jgi:hypothetical protein
MSTSNETWCLYNDSIVEITWTRVKSLRCSEPISLVRSHSDLSQWITTHFCISVRGQNQIINIQSYDHIKVFLNSLKIKIMVNRTPFKLLK